MKLKLEIEAREKAKFDAYWQRKANEKYDAKYGGRSGTNLPSGGKF